LKAGVDVALSNPTDLVNALGIPLNVQLIIALIPFAVGLITIALLVRGMHKRTFSETVNGRAKIRWNRVFTGFAVWFLLMLVFLAISYIVDPANLRIQFDARQFIPLLVIALLLIPFQTTFEEYVFRGYLAQGIAAWTKNRWAVILIPGILFGLMHYSNPEVKEFGFWLSMPQYIMWGIIFGLIAVLDDGIELPIGIHAANNIFACLFVTHKASALQTPAIFEQLKVDPLSDMLGLLIAGALTVFIFSRKYKWDFRILNRKMEQAEEMES
jgi:membrane protease YdiL (CAAX protease family)